MGSLPMVRALYSLRPPDQDRLQTVLLVNLFCLSPNHPSKHTEDIQANSSNSMLFMGARRAARTVDWAAWVVTRLRLRVIRVASMAATVKALEAIATMVTTSNEVDGAIITATNRRRFAGEHRAARIGQLLPLSGLIGGEFHRPCVTTKFSLFLAPAHKLDHYGRSPSIEQLRKLSVI